MPTTHGGEGGAEKAPAAGGGGGAEHALSREPYFRPTPLPSFLPITYSHTHNHRHSVYLCLLLLPVNHGTAGPHGTHRLGWANPPLPMTLRRCHSHRHGVCAPPPLALHTQAHAVHTLPLTWACPPPPSAPTHPHRHMLHTCFLDQIKYMYEQLEAQEQQG